MSVRVTDFNPLGTIDITRGDSFIIDFIVRDDSGNPIDLTNYHIHAVIKHIKEIYNPDSEAYLEFSSYDDSILKTSDGQVIIEVSPEQSMRLPVATNTYKPLLFSIVVTNKEKKFRKEYQYFLIVRPNVVSRTY